MASEKALEILPGKSSVHRMELMQVSAELDVLCSISF